MLERRLIAVEGLVQGVGFRPFVHRLASDHGLRGYVRNDAIGVRIDVEGQTADIERFSAALMLDPPPLASIERIRTERARPTAYEGFQIATSDVGGIAAPLVPTDVATCEACLAELFDPSNRRFGHPFITCTDCGPRFTIVRDAPYDRERTSMAGFAMCSECRAEYASPSNRRFHAEAIACGSCGPRLRSVTGAHDSSARDDDAALAAAVESLREGHIVAIKALGGYHLACDATNTVAVERLRSRKHRVAKPFALMVRDVAVARSLADVNEAEARLLSGGTAPIVLVKRKPAAAVSDAVAPGQRTLGVMLPATPLHHLLIRALDRPLVMTSGNRSDEPVAIDERVALDTLAPIADLFLTHDRPIEARCDDSVVRVTGGQARAVRRARGYVPRRVPLAATLPQPVLSLGSHAKNTVCVIAGRHAVVSPHIGDLDTLASREAFREAIAQTIKSSAVTPVAIAHDLHPDYASTRMLTAVAEELGVGEHIPVQHHHAHVASCVAERGEREPVIGVAFDGAGLGTDGAIWGGEFLLVDGHRFTRCGHLSYVPLPGGDAAARRPWVSAASHTVTASGSSGLEMLHPPTAGDGDVSMITQMLLGRVTMPSTSSAGRLFDAVASILGLCHVSRFEGEAAMLLEQASDPRSVRRYPVELSSDPMWAADCGAIVRGVISDLKNGIDVATIAGAFHRTLAQLVLFGAQRIRNESNVRTVVLSGGVFANDLLLTLASESLAAHGFRVVTHAEVPCNDGGLSLGQAYVAACSLESNLCA